MEIQDNSGFLVDTQMRLDKSLTKDCDTDHDQPTWHQDQELGNLSFICYMVNWKFLKIDIYQI